MQRGLGAILLIGAAMVAGCSGSGAPPTSPTAQSTAGGATGASAQSNNSGVEVTGTVDALPPATPAGTFTTAGKTVVTNAATMFDDGDVAMSFADLKLGMKVEVYGTASGNTITATRVDIEDAPAPPNPNPAPQPEPEPEPHDPNPPAPTPPMPNPPAPIPPAPMPPPGNGDDDHGNTVEVEGTLGTIGGTCPSISSTVGTTKFTTNASTRFDEVACTALQAGSKVQVKGTRNADGSITATRVERD